MNGYERIMAAFCGEHPDTVPIMLHNFMMAAREAGSTMEKFRSDSREIARCFIEAVERYGYDGIVLDVDTVTLAGAAGVPIDFPADEPARARGSRISSIGDVRALEPVDIRQYYGIQVWLEAMVLLKHYFRDEILLRGNCDQCPFTLASMVRGIDGWMQDLLDPEKEEDVRALLEYCTEMTVQFVTLMAATGAHMASNGDSVASPDLISPSLYRRFALPYEQRVVSRSHENGLHHVLHICGNTGSILAEMMTSGSDGLELDYKTDPVLAHDALKQRTVFIGNIDPSGVLALGTPQLVEAKTRQLLTIFSDTPRFVLNAGCAISPMTPSDNLRAMILTARSYS